jgi:hypothetical protein
MLRDVEFADQAFELLAVNLTAYGWGVLCAWLRSGMIFSKCAEQGRPVIPSDGERDRFGPALIAGILATAVACALGGYRIGVSRSGA